MIQRITRINPERQQADLLVLGLILVLFFPRIKKQLLLKRSKRKTIAKIKSVICYLLVLGAAAGGNNAVLVLVANSKTEESQR